MENLLQRKRIIVTGGAGFLGSHLTDKLRDRDCTSVCVPRKSDYDLRNRSEIEKLFRDFPPQIVIHLSASVGGIGANQARPGVLFYDNAIMGIELIEQCRKAAIEKLVLLGTVCAYPKFCPAPFRETNLWNGYPEETNAPYGLAKKMLLVQAEAYRKQYGLNAIYLLPVNLYGPRDNFDLQTSHVIPAIIRKCFEAKAKGQTEVVLWGTGTATREFLYVEDAAEGILLATEYYNKSEPVNLGSGHEITVCNLVNLISKLTGFDGRVVYDSSRPDGQPRRRLDTSKAEQEFGFKAKIGLDEGLEKTIEWYLAARHGK